MNIKEIVSLVVVAAGIYLVGCGFYTRSHTSSARSEIHKMAESKNSIVQSVGKDMEKKLGSSGGTGSIVTGILLILVGGGAAYYFRKKHKR